MFGDIQNTTGIQGNALRFNGSGWIVFDGLINSYLSSTNDFTISFYFKADTTPQIHTSLFSKRTVCNVEQMLDIRRREFHVFLQKLWNQLV